MGRALLVLLIPSPPYPPIVISPSPVAIIPQCSMSITY
jgi:hypothetical protein